jgi:hypothetical protein
MALRNLLEDGDAIEKATWPFIRNYFPHYETFWQIHIVPLRSADSIHPRRGIDEDFEFLAMQHYSLYVNLGNAYKKIQGTEGEPLASPGFPDEIYGILHRAAELAVKVVGRFEKIFDECLGRNVQVDTSRIQSLMARIVRYRNLIHQELPAVQVDATGRLLIPRPEKLEKYARWTDVLYRPRAEDFVDVGRQLMNDFCALCSALESTWKSLCELSKQLSESRQYLRRRAQGESVPVVSLTSPSASGRVFISALSGPVASAVPGVIMTRKPDE